MTTPPSPAPAAPSSTSQIASGVPPDALTVAQPGGANPGGQAAPPPPKWPLYALAALQGVGAIGCWQLWAQPAKVIALLLALSAIAQMILDFLPSSTKSKPLLSAVARLVPVIAAVGLIFSA